MRTKPLAAGDRRTWAVVFDPGDDPIEGLTGVAGALGLGAAQLTAIGGFRSAMLGYFDPERRDYRRIPVDEQVEVLSFLGDITAGPDGPAVHVHTVLGRADGGAIGGHLLGGRVRPTLEVIVTEAPAALRRRYDEATGLPLIDLDASV